MGEKFPDGLIIILCIQLPKISILTPAEQLNALSAEAVKKNRLRPVPAG